MTDTTLFLVVVVLAVIGFLLGFARVLKICTSHIFGLIIAVFACVMLGGVIQNISVVREFIVSIDNKAIELADFLKYLHVGYIAFYLLLFISVRILRRITIKLIKVIFDRDSKFIKLINRTLGAVFIVAFCVGLLLVFLAVVNVVEETSFGVKVLSYIEGSLIQKLYEINPISFKF